MTAKTIKRSNDKNIAKNKKKQIKVNSIRSLTKICENVAGIDVGGEYHYVAAPDPKHDGKIAVNRFGSFTPNLQECVDWLKGCNIQSAAMEATGSYWTILYAMLKEAGIEVLLVNPRDFKKMKDKKTDVCDAEYLQLYHSYGLLEGAIVPEKRIGELRTYFRLREQAVRDSATSIQRMQKALINMNLRLDNVLSDISGVTGMNIIKAILAGQRDPKVLAQYRDKRCKKSQEEIEDSLKGFYQEDHLFALDFAFQQFEFDLANIRKCDEMIEAKLSQFETHPNYQPEENLKNIFKKLSKRKSAKKSFEFSFDLKKEINRIVGVDLTSLPAVGPSIALKFVSEVGIDMSRWKSPKHLASWIGVAPNNKVSGGRILHSGTKRKKRDIAISIRMAVSSLYNEVNDTALGAFYRRKRAQKGAPKAITAAANKLVRQLYMTISTGKPYIEMGAQKYYELQKEKYLRRVKKQVSQWGYELSPKEPQNENSIKTG
jgi:transposase